MHSENKIHRNLFPPVDSADESGLLALSLDIDTDYLQAAYRNGIFPWPVEEEYILWFSPPSRAILEFSDFHISRRAGREFRKRGFKLRINENFSAVIRECSFPRAPEDGTWITEKIIKAYSEFNQQGFALSFETLNPEGKLVGGLYGVLIGTYFSGESMFHRESAASKFALAGAVEYLGKQGLTWLDAQVISENLIQFGVKEIPRSEFIKKLRPAINN